MEHQKTEIENKTDRLTYTKPQLTVFGDVRSLTATGSANGSEGGPNPMTMSMP